ncbi:4Fe-4S binding protein [Desulfoferrobacter suflitae]|uniref:4Fe-4S binding protein n=1 Tax=Desulfoferrobacter suflitae TaxID=2865782 RepID=UPI003EBE9929
MEGEQGDFQVKVRRKPRYVDLDKCISCGACAEKCPTVVIDAYNAGLGERKAIYKYYAQAIPSAYAIDSDNCRQLGQGKKCGICAKVCPTGAIDYKQKEQMLDLEVGAVILSTGFHAFDPGRFDTYNYAGLPNVVTAMEFERLLSAGGPTSGHLMRPSELSLKADLAAAEKGLSKLHKQLKQLEGKYGKTTGEMYDTFQSAGKDDKDLRRWETLAEQATELENRLRDLKAKQETAHEPKKIAWLQCVGSREINQCDNGYCSGVCCMYAIKEAVIAKEHAKDGLEAAIFFMDMRTYGKEFEQYYNRAQESGIRFVRSRIHTVESVPENDNLRLGYVTESGDMVSEDFDMVVLSVGLESSPEMQDLAAALGIELDHYNFAATSSFAPVATSRPGVFVCGVLQGPKDIPLSVMEASAAAGAAASNLSSARHTLVKEKTFPEERDVRAEPPRIGVFVCNCGVNISSVVRVKEVVEYAKSLPNVVYVQENLFSCSQDAQDKLVEVIKEQDLNRVVVAACSPRTHEPLFQETLRNSALNKYLYEQANIRDQCSWVHAGDPDAATEKAKDLVRMSVSRAALIEPLPMPSVPVTASALIVGGGVAGMVSALTLAKQGFKSTIVEQKDRLGGHALKLKKTWKGEDVSEFLGKLVEEVKAEANIDVLLNAEIKDTSGFVGNFKTTVSSNGTESLKEIEHGVTILATGAHSIAPQEYFYGKSERVFRWHELDEAWDSDLVKNASSAVFIQCVGSREPQRPHCSKICCTFSVQKAVELKERNPDMDVYILYRDIRTYGEREDLYKEARRRGVIFVRFDTDHKPVVEQVEGGLQVTVIDHILRRPITLKADFATLASAIETRDIAGLAQQFKVPVSQDNFFLEVHMKLRPVDFATDGVFVCGLAHYPKPIDESIAQAQAAAARAATILAQKSIEVEGVVSTVDETLCRGCGKCVEVCPYGAPQLVEVAQDVHVSRIQEALCKGCGACAVACPTGAAAIRHFNDREVLTMVEAALCE